MDIDWAKVTIFTPDRESKNIKVEDLYLTILIRTNKAMRIAKKIKEICKAMHLLDPDAPMQFGLRFWAGPSENLNLNFRTQLTPIQQLAMHTQINSVVDANRTDKNSGHGKGIIIRCERADIGYQYAIRLAERS